MNTSVIPTWCLKTGSIYFQSGFDSLKEELGPSRESTLPRQEAISEKDDHDEDFDEAEDEGDKLAAEEKITEKMSFRHQQQFETGRNFDWTYKIAGGHNHNIRHDQNFLTFDMTWHF